MKLNIGLMVIIIMLAFVLPASSETVGDLQKEEKEIIVIKDNYQKIELLSLKNRIIIKHNEIQTFEKKDNI